MYGGLARLNASQKSGPSQHPRVEVSDVNLKTHCLEKKVEHVAIIPIHTFIRASYMNLSRHFSLIAKNTLKTAHTPTPPYPTLSYPVPAISTSASSSSSSSSGMNRFPSSLYQNHIHIHIRHHMKANVSKSASRITHARTQPPPLPPPRERPNDAPDDPQPASPADPAGSSASPHSAAAEVAAARRSSRPVAGVASSASHHQHLHRSAPAGPRATHAPTRSPTCPCSRPRPRQDKCRAPPPREK